MGTRHHRKKSLLLNAFAAGQGERSHGPAMERPKESDKLAAAGMVAGHLESRFHRFGPRIAEVNPFPGVSRHERRKFFGERDHIFVIEVGARHVDQLGGLFLNSLNHLGMAMSGGRDGDSGIEIEETIPIDILNDGSAAASNHQRIGTGIGGRQNGAVPSDDGPGVRPWK